jgi:hypothetical protein
MAPLLRRHLSASNLLALAAIFMVLGGSSYAAVKLKAGSVTSRTVKDGSLLRRDFRAGELTTATRAESQSGASGAAGPKGDAGPQGEKGEKGEKGDKGEAGPSEAQSVYRDGNAAQVPALPTTLATLDVSPGAYLIEAKLVAVNANKGTTPVVCELHAGQAKDEAFAQVGAAALSLHLTTTFAASGVVTLECSTGNQLVSVAAGDVRLTAVKLGKETSTSL